MNNLPPKPVSEEIHPELTRLPELTLERRVIRRFLQFCVKGVVRVCTRMKVIGRENIPRHGPFLVVSNHLGDADLLVGIATVNQINIEILGKIELYHHPFAGPLMQAYGTIWVHRGQPDRRAIRAVLQGLSENRIVAMAPEGRQSVTGGLERGTDGAAYIALKANVPVLPVGLTGTENQRIYANLKRFRRTRVSITVGEPFYLPDSENRKQAIQDGTEEIMFALAKLLPAEYRGIYQIEAE